MNLSKSNHVLPWNYRASLIKNHDFIRTHINNRNNRFKSQLLYYRSNTKAKYYDMKAKKTLIKEQFQAQIKEYQEKQL